MRRLTLILFVTLAPVFAQQPTQPPALRRSGVFDGTTRLRIAERGGTPRLADVRIQVDDWIINQRQKVDALPVQYGTLLIVQVRGGDVTTTINGQRQRRKEEEFWTVPAGTVMSLETGDDSVSIQTVAVSGG
jgi:quercetin dioxygenase-like cupin family protein